MSLIEVQADLKETVKQLKRIADALQIIVSQEYGFNMQPPQALQDSKEEDSVDYTTDENMFKQELEDIVRPPVEDDDKP